MNSGTILELLPGVKFSCTFYGQSLNNITQGVIVGKHNGTVLRDPQTANVNHINVYPTIPNQVQQNIPNDYTKYDYILVKLLDGTLAEIGLPWIVPESITIHQVANTTITVPDCDQAGAAPILALIRSIGYTNVSSITQ